MDRFIVEAYTPKEIAARVEAVSVSKSSTDPLRVFVLSLLAGAFIAFGAALFTLVTHDYSPELNQGLLRLVGGLSFCLGLVLVVVAGAELFTGNNLLVIAYMDNKISFAQLMKNWLIVYAGNFVGALGVVVLIYLSGHWLIGGGAVGAKAIVIAEAKVELSFMAAFARGVLCNVLVCLAVWLCFAGRSVTDKILAILFPITAFVALGFEHSVANMYFIPAGMLAVLEPQAVQIAGQINPALDIEALTVSGFLVNNLLPVTMGNIVGGSLFVAIVYWFLYVRD